MSGTAARTLLDTAFGDGARLTALLDARNTTTFDSKPWLHYVALVPRGWDGHSGPPVLSDSPPVILESNTDFHRWTWDRARVRLTLCAGELPKVLGQLQLQAHEVWWVHAIDADSVGMSIKALASLCQPGASVHTTPSWAALADWHAAGFAQLEPSAPQQAQALPDHGQVAGPAATLSRLTFAPAWPVRRSRQAHRVNVHRPARCVVVGAGVSGAAIADAMARRAWAVTVVEADTQAAQGGSGVPAALIAPLPSADDNPATRLTRHGLRWMRQTLHSLSAAGLLHQGLDWEASGVTRVLETGERQWQADGLWLRPAALVRAWLAHPQIRFCGGCQVARISRQDACWQLDGEDGRPLAQAELVVFANALGCQKVLFPADIEPRAASALSMLRAAYGTVSLGLTGGLAHVPAAPVNGAGSLIPALPGPRHAEPRRWLVGADFSAQPLPITQAHAANLHRMQALAPDMLAAWHDEAANQLPDALAHWQGQRCISHDRMPLVGPLLPAPDASLWISAGMGARGMAWAGVCAEWLASRISGEPWPLARDLARHVDSQRSRTFIRDKT